VSQHCLFFHHETVNESDMWGRMPWTRKLPSLIELKDGRTLVTLADARDAMRTLPRLHQRREHWLYAGALIHEAANGGGAMGETQAHLTRALRVEGLI
jgi:hypothetical protein